MAPVLVGKDEKFLEYLGFSFWPFWSCYNFSWYIWASLIDVDFASCFDWLILLLWHPKSVCSVEFDAIIIGPFLYIKS